MNRAMYSGVAGLKTHQTRMDVIGNNIANVNTVGYKAQAALFSELLYQNSSNATGPNSNTGLGGINPKQVGLGVKMASISTNITLPGSAETTNNPFDIRITGDSFFVVNNGRDNLFTRDGSFKVDAAGNLVMSSNGYKVMGWLPDEDNPSVIKPDTVTALQIMNAANMTYPAEATTQAYISGIVDEESPEVNSEDGKIMNLNFYDARGYSYTAKLALKKVADTGDTVNSYSCELVKVLNSSGKDVTKEIGASMDTMSAGIDEIKKPIVGPTYSMTKDNGAYVIRYNDGTIFRDFRITDSGVQVLSYADQNFTAPGTAENMEEAEIWKNLSKAFGYTGSDADVKEFKNLAYKDPADPGATVKRVGPKLDGLKVVLDAQFPDATHPVGTEIKEVVFNNRYFEGCIVNFNKSNGDFAGIGAEGGGNYAQLSFGVGDEATGDALSFSPIRIDFSALSNQGNEKVTTASATNGSLSDKALGAGRMVGNMSGLSIGQDGKIYATYDNGQSKLLGQIAVARFANASGLQKEGDNLYVSTQNSGDFDGIGVDITSDGGYMTPGELEMSNVDLSNELTGMIVTQRGFQANSRIITVSDTMLEELVNLKR